MNLTILETTERSPDANFALEERLSRTLPPDTCLLRLWTNDPCLAVGRFQAIEHEVDVTLATERGIPIFRRSTGGGTVYLDPGCLCVTFARPRNTPLVSRNVFDEGRHLTELVRDAIAHGNHPVAFTIDDRNGLFADGRKIAGTAVRLTRDLFFWHLSLLVATDLSALRAYLLPDDPEPDDVSRVKSRRSPVVNLFDLFPEVTVDRCRVAVRETFVAALKRRFGALAP